MLVYLFSSNLSNPSTGGGISSDLCRRNSLGTSHSRHGSESEWPAVSSKRLESVKSHSIGLETKSSCGLDCENSPSRGLVSLEAKNGTKTCLQSETILSPHFHTPPPFVDQPCRRKTLTIQPTGRLGFQPSII